MELGLSNTLLAGDPRLVDHIVGEVKSQGIFDQFRKECIADVDTKPAYQNLHTRVEGSVNSFLSKQTWKPDLNKNQLRETLRKHIHDAPYLDAGVERIVDQVVNPKVYSVFMPQIEDVVYKFLGIERPKTREKNGACGLKDLLPKDLDPVSPESDKNSLKDVSLESVDAMDDFEEKKEEKVLNEQKPQDEETLIEKPKDYNLENGQLLSEDRVDDAGKNFNKTGSNLNLNISGKSDDKTEEEEEDSPTFEPIDIMNLNESNISNDSHLSEISELTSHRSRSPDFCNELSRDNFDYSNQDSQLSKVSSDSRLSIVTDFGSSNHASTPLHDSLKDDTNKDKCDKTVKDNFKAVREFDLSKNKNTKNIFELNKSKDVIQDVKDSKSKSSLSSKENSRDATDNSVKDKYDHKHSKDRNKENDSSKSKSKDKNHVKDSKYYKDKGTDRKKERSHSSSAKYDKYEKYDKSKPKDKNDQSAEKLRDSSEKVKDPESPRDSSKIRDDKPKDQDKKDNSSKEIKDLKDLYKEKIRELREKKELTEKEKLSKDKDLKVSKESKEKRDSPKDRKPYKKEPKSSSSRSSCISGHDGKRGRTPDKTSDGKERRSESRDKGKRDEKRPSKDGKPKNHATSKIDAPEKSDRQDTKKTKIDDKGDKTEVKKDTKLNNEKSNGKKDSRSYHSQTKTSSRNDKFEGKRDTKGDSQNKDKKRKEEKKPKPKDDHSSLRKDTNDRRSSDRDGSNGSSSKSTQSNASVSSSSSSKSNTNLLKDVGSVSNSSGETSDSVEETNATERKDSDPVEPNLPLKKRPLHNDDGISAEVKVKKPKFAKNFQEAKKLMKIRKQMEKQQLKETRKVERKSQPVVEPSSQTNATNSPDNFESVPDEERVQIIEVRDEEYEEPYPEMQSNLTLDASALMLLECESGAKDLLDKSNLKLKLSDMELCIGQSLTEESNSSFKLAKEIIAEPPAANPALSDIQTIAQKESTSSVKQEENPVKTKDPLVTDSENIVLKEEQNNSQNDKQTTLPKDSQPSEVATKECNTTSECNSSIESKAEQKMENKTPVGEVSAVQTENPETPETATDKEELQENNDEKDEIPTVQETTETTSQKNIVSTGSTPTMSTTEDIEECRYFTADNEKSEKFANFLESFHLMGNNSLEDIIECLGGQMVSSMPQSMAPPLPKRKHSPSPLTDILLNNSDNNNDAHKSVLNSPSDDSVNSIKKRKLIPPKKQRLHANICAPQGLLNGENFVMPLSPESDVSATSEKIPSASLIKEEKGDSNINVLWRLFISKNMVI